MYDHSCWLRIKLSRNSNKPSILGGNEQELGHSTNATSRPMPWKRFSNFMVTGGPLMEIATHLAYHNYISPCVNSVFYSCSYMIVTFAETFLTTDSSDTMSCLWHRPLMLHIW